MRETLARQRRRGGHQRRSARARRPASVIRSRVTSTGMPAAEDPLRCRRRQPLAHHAGHQIEAVRDQQGVGSAVRGSWAAAPTGGVRRRSCQFHCAPVRLARDGRSLHLGRASAPTQPVHTMRGPNAGTAGHRARVDGDDRAAMDRPSDSRRASARRRTDSAGGLRLALLNEGGEITISIRQSSLPTRIVGKPCSVSVSTALPDALSGAKTTYSTRPSSIQISIFALAQLSDALRICCPILG
jgi:hypothetical protein